MKKVTVTGNHQALRTVSDRDIFPCRICSASGHNALFHNTARNKTKKMREEIQKVKTYWSQQGF